MTSTLKIHRRTFCKGHCKCDFRQIKQFRQNSKTKLSSRKIQYKVCTFSGNCNQKSFTPVRVNPPVRLRKPRRLISQSQETI